MHEPDWQHVGVTKSGKDEYVCREPGCDRRIEVGPDQMPSLGRH